MCMLCTTRAVGLLPAGKYEPCTMSGAIGMCELYATSEAGLMHNYAPIVCHESNFSIYTVKVQPLLFTAKG